VAPTELYALNYLSAEALAKADQLFSLFSHFFELLTEHRNATDGGPASDCATLEAIDGDLKPVALLTFDNEFVVPEEFTGRMPQACLLKKC
jgi:hypothetical protein